MVHCASPDAPLIAQNAHFYGVNAQNYFTVSAQNAFCAFCVNGAFLKPLCFREPCCLETQLLQHKMTKGDI